jgi:hypothetical protein
VCRIEISSYINEVKLEVKGMKLGLLVFRRPARFVNESQNLIMIGLLRRLCGEADENVMTRYQDYGSRVENLSEFIF